MFNTEIQAIQASVETIGNRIELQLTLGIGVPQEDGLAFLPAGLIRVPMGKKMAADIGKELKEQSEELAEPPKPSGLVIPENAHAVAQAVKADGDS